jgi:ribose-phosphate pyrophosphokinase
METRSPIVICVEGASCSFAEKIIYPAGEMQVRIRPEFLTQIRAATEINVHATGIGSAESIIHLMLLRSALIGAAELADSKLHLKIPYLPYARADRRFVPGDCAGLGEIIGSFTGWDSISTLDVHNFDKADMIIGTDYFNFSAAPLIRHAIRNFGPDLILFPDAGASLRYGRLDLASQVRAVCAKKKRDSGTGKFIGFEVPNIDEAKRILIIDDICDGGGTFVGIASEIRKQSSDVLMGLCVTHGIFSKGRNREEESLNKYFRRYYTTNSFIKFDSTEMFHCLDAFDVMEGKI